MAKRVTLNARVAPADKERILRRAEEEGRSIGEVVALLLRENELVLRELEDERVSA
jgi:hypothetical protein